jgi:hypothetical protein
MRAKTYIFGAVFAVAWVSPAHAYRPFDDSDADVLGHGEVEFELGYLHLLREGSQRSLVTPAGAMNFGLEHKRELAFEGRIRTPLNGDSEPHRPTFENGGVFLKQLHREGSLQERSGPSVASECGLLIPSRSGERTGAGCAAIVSGRGEAGAVHFNGALNRNREGSWETFLGAIVEGSGLGAFRPVGEVFAVHDAAGRHTQSALVGVIWTAREGLTFDVALRKARTEEHGLTELRVGLTWDVPAARAR